MSNLQNLIVDIVALSGGRLVGRTRMQKTAYLLDAKGMKSGAAYYYYNFGPFSDEVADGISDSKFVGSLVEKIDYRKVDGSPFSIFESGKPADQVEALGDLKRSEATGLLNRLAAANSTVLELAATIHWLIFVEKVADWRAELKRRKGAKIDGGRMDKAADLLTHLGFAIV
jgi:uncharacterized protein YwgA